MRSGSFVLANSLEKISQIDCEEAQKSCTVDLVSQWMEGLKSRIEGRNGTLEGEKEGIHAQMRPDTKIDSFTIPTINVPATSQTFNKIW